MPDEQGQSEQTDQQGQQQQNQGGDGDDGNDVTGLKEALRKEREARRALERDIKPLRTFKQERDNAERTAEERVTAKEREVTDRERALVARERNYNLRDDITRVLAAEDFRFTFQEGVTTDRVIRLLDLSDDDWDGDKPKNVKKLLADLQKSDGYLFQPKRQRPGPGDAGERGTPPHVVGTGVDRMRAAYEQTTQQRR